MKHRKKIIVTAIFLLPFIFGFVKSTVFPERHPYEWNYDAQVLGMPVIPEDNPMTIEGVALGRLLFYDSLLSVNQNQSCGSCHLQQYSFSDGKKLSIGTFGDTLERNAISLVNLAWTKYFFWDGRVKHLEDLIKEPLFNKKEMAETESSLLDKLKKHPYYPILFRNAFQRDEITIKEVSYAISQFLRTIVAKPIHLPDSVLNIPPNGVSEQEYTMQNLTAPTTRGTYFRFALMCGSCHNNAAYSFDDGLATNMVNNQNQLMKIPSLVNISYTAPYMHDGRFNTIEEVFTHYSQHIDSLLIKNPQLNISKKYGDIELKNLINEYDMKYGYQFFKFLSDPNILTNKAFSNPFYEYNFSWENYISK
ncbi:MAG: hypothetical protein IPL21_01895 [Saprospirales bacterium]|nr:hypothetical protein [Saprospirales bacterium]